MPIVRNNTAEFSAVLDTNVLVSALLAPRGVPRRIVSAAVEETFRLISSPPLLKELEAVLSRVKFARRAGKRTADEFLEVVRGVAVLVQPTERVHVITTDPGDNAVLEAAVAGHADVVVTGDRRHLLPLRKFRGIPIVTPRTFMDSLRVGG